MTEFDLRDRAVGKNEVPGGPSHRVYWRLELSKDRRWVVRERDSIKCRQASVYSHIVFMS